MIVIGDLKVGDGRLSFQVEGGPGDCLWYEVEPEYQSWLAIDRYDAAVIALLPYAMKTGKPIRVIGGITGLLLHNLRSGIMPILKEQKRSLQRIEIDAAGLETHARPGSAAVMTGLTCGIDSLSTVRTHLDHPLASLRITHFSFHDVGSHGRVDPEAVFARRLAHARGASAELDRPLVVVRSNLGVLPGYNYQQHHTLLNGSAAIALARGVGTYLYSSSTSYRGIHARASTDTATADPIILPLLSGSGVACISANAEMPRVEKTALMADWPFAQRWLDVCVTRRADGRNCSMCWKCCRTILTLELLGKLDAFAHRFDLKLYRKVKNAYISYLLNTRPAPPTLDVLRLARRKGVPLASMPRRIRALGRRWTLKSIQALPQSLRSRLRRRLRPF